MAWEERRHLLRREWVAVAAHRQSPPWNSERLTTSARSVNLPRPAGMNQNRPAQGLARVVGYTPRHDLSLAELDPAAIVRLLVVWQDQYRELGERPEVQQLRPPLRKSSAVPARHYEDRH